MATHKISTNKLEKQLDEMHHRRSLLEQELAKDNLRPNTYLLLILRHKRTMETIEKLEHVIEDFESN